VSARQARHRFVTVDHLLVELLDEPSMVVVLADRGVDVEYLRREVRKSVSRIDPGSPEETVPTTDFQRTIQNAIHAVQTAGRTTVELVDILTFALRCRNPKESPF